MASTDAAFPIADADLFAESAIPELEKLLRDPVHGRVAGKNLIRLYNVYPGKLVRDNVIAALALGLTALPRNDFQLSLYMLPASLRADVAVRALEECERLAQLGRFADFWAKTKDASLAGPLTAATGFAAGMRSFMLGALNRTYQKIEVAELKGFLGTDDAAAVAQQNGWTIEGTTAVAPAIPENTPRPKKTFDEGLQYQDVKNLVSTLTKA